MSWRYDRRWIEIRDYDSPRIHQAQERLNKWGWQRRWLRFPQLGPIPDKWLDVGPPPTSPTTYFNEIFLATGMIEAIAEQINAPNPLLTYFRA